jgi:hypothetical protein
MRVTFFNKKGLLLYSFHLCHILPGKEKEIRWATREKGCTRRIEIRFEREKKAFILLASLNGGDISQTDKDLL